MDGEGNLLAVWENGIWGGAAMVDFSVAAGIKFGTQDDPTLPPLRSDAIKIFDVPALFIMRLCSGTGIAFFGSNQLHIVPDVIAVPVMVLALLGAIVAFILWKKASRVGPEVAERRRRIVQEALSERDIVDGKG
jgi:hypothetical protein